MTKGGEVLKNNYTVSSRKRFLFYLYFDDIKSALYHGIAVFWTE